MKLIQVMTHSSLAAIALLHLAVVESAIAEPVVVTRGPNGAAHVVQADNIPVDATILPNHQIGASAAKEKSHVGGVAHQEQDTLVQRGPNGAFFPSRTN